MSNAFRVCAILSLAVTACTQAPSPTPGLQADRQAATPADDWESWTAVGNEPGWILKLEGEELSFKWNYGSDEAVLPRPAPSVSTNGRRYVSRTAAHDLRVDVRYRICRDTMSGMPYPHEVSVIIDESAFSGCGGSPASLLQGGEWVVEDLAGNGIVDRSRATLDFGGDGQVTGRASCNRYGAAWRLSGEGLTISSARATRIACSPALDNQEIEFLGLLEGTHRFDIAADGALLLHTADGATVKARRE